MTVLNPLPISEQEVIEPIVGSKMLELGNKKNSKGTYKNYFESLGIEHTSVDWNGLDGALKLDLRVPINLGQFDMVTNIGTTEHVSEQTPVWKNVHEAVKLGGVLVSITPKPGDWWWHGEYYPTQEFYKQFAELNGYTVENLSEAQNHPTRIIRARMRKVKDLPFQMPKSEYIFFNEMRPRVEPVKRDGKRWVKLAAAVQDITEEARKEKYKKGWGSGLPETPCGSGSVIKNTEKQRTWIPEVIRKYNIKSIADIGAGDLQWVKMMDLSGVEYSAYDFHIRHPDVKYFDLLKEIPPKVDLIMCLWVINHFPYDHAVKAMANIKASGSKYLMITGKEDWHEYQPPEVSSEPLEIADVDIKDCYIKLIKL